MNLKKLIIALLLASNLIYAQDYAPVLDLLINNKRAEARKLFDKQFGKTKTSSIDLLFLDTFIDQEMGLIDFDETLIKNLENLPNSEYYIAPYINNSFILADVEDDYCNDLTYKKINYLNNSSKFKNLPIVLYRKPIFERKLLKNEEAKKTFKQLNSIDQWQFCGVFENLNGSGLNNEYEPESYAKNDKLFDANSNGKLGWYNPKRVQDEAYHFFTNEGEYGNGIIYAQSFIETKEQKTYLLNFGASAGLKIFLNDREIYINSDIKSTNLDAYRIKINLEKGVNRLLFKIEMAAGQDYFSAQIKNIDGSVDNTLVYSNKYVPYIISADKSSIETETIALDYEKYFDDLVKNNPKNLLYKMFQFAAYESNNKKEKAFESIDGLNTLYPKSSLIAGHFMRYYKIEGNESEKIQEILKNIENYDSEYYVHSFSKMLDQTWLKSASIQELEKYRDICKQYKQNYGELMFDFMLISRKSNIDDMLKKLDEIIENSYNNEKFISIKATLLLSLKNDKTNAITLLENLNKDKEIMSVINSLSNHYSDLNQKDKVKEIYKQKIERYNYYNAFRNDLIGVLIDENQYEKAIELINENLEYFPYSFTNMEKKSTVYGLMKNQKEEEKYIRQSLTHNSGNSNLRKKLYDITKTPDEIEQVEIKDIYKNIKETRNSKLKCNYGVVTLLDQYIINVFPEGGRKIKITYTCEIVAENGIEEMKEYSIDTYDNTILKSEIVKADGSLVPAEKGDNLLVFKDLKVGDVIYIEYEKYENGTGRFYKDFNITNYFNSTYPVAQSLFAIITPDNFQYNTDFSNGIIPSEIKKVNNKTAKIWKQKAIEAIPLIESYSNTYIDIINKIQIGTIKSWSDISNWYSDLVQKSLKLDKITKDTFNEIFKDGVKNLSEDEIAKKIYAYIENNIKYSSLDFRQSGFVPQKPSKTITTKLGDCKDVSTLFVALSNLAGLKSNLVLVLTNDNGFKSLPLPTTEFNHCIVKTTINNKDYFLELTDKYLPFKAMPSSLYKANALVISFDKNQKSELINLPFDNSIKSKIESKTTVDITEKEKIYTCVETISGANKSYFNELFSSSTTDDVRKDDVEKDYANRTKKTVKVLSSNLIKNEIFDESITFENKFSISEKPQVVGNLKITDIPITNRIFTRDIINDDARKYDICYYKYENCLDYETTVIINIDAAKKFTEIPENKTFQYKKHNYSIQFELVKPNSLKVLRKATTPWDDISVAEYPEFKKYVETIIETEEQILGYK